MIKIQNLVKRHGSLDVLTGVDAQVKHGEIIAITGPSGVGKSTLLRCLNGLENFHEGTIDIAGFHLTKKTKPGGELRQLRARVGMVFQQFNLFPHLTALENVALAPRVIAKTAAAAADEEARELLERVHLENKAVSYPHQLSGGQQQRVAIARALALKPSVILFDEPTSALDPAMKQEVLDVMKELAATGMTMLIVTHELNFVSTLATRVWEMQAGKIMRDNGPSHR